MKSNGILGVIISNSWLATKAGDYFYRAISKLFYIEQVHISGNGKWFKNAQVVTTILVLRKKEADNIENTQDISFFLWKKSLGELDSVELREELILTALQNIETDGEVVKVRKYSLNMIEDALSYNLSKNALFHDVSWITEIGNKLCRKNTIFKVIRGERRGWDKMFYPETDARIDPEFVKPALLSSRSLTSLQAVPDGQAFCCGLSIADLQNAGKTDTLNWIK